MFILLRALVGCSAGPAETGETDLPSGALTIDNLEVQECQSGDTGAAAALQATDMGNGSVLVVHTGYRAECCLSFDVTASLADGTIRADYAPRGEPCDCTCAYSFSYRVETLPAGTYTVDAGDQSTEVTVEG